MPNTGNIIRARFIYKIFIKTPMVASLSLGYDTLSFCFTYLADIYTIIEKDYHDE